MLVLTQSQGETIFITCPDGSEISISLFGIKGKRTKVGLEAPGNYAIARSKPYRGGMSAAYQSTK